MLLSSSNFLIGCLNTISQKDSLFLFQLKQFRKLPSEIEDRIDADVTDNSDKVTICSTTISSTSNTLNKLLVNTSPSSSYIQKQFNDKKEEIINILSAYVAPLIK